MYILFDIGGTKIRLAVSGDGENISEPQVHITPQSFEEGIALISNYCKQAASDQTVDAISGGFPGVFGKDGLILRAPNLSGWIGRSIHSSLKELAGASPVNIQNDADLAGLGEAIRGAGKGYKIVAYFTVSTGVGGTRIVDQNIDVSNQGFEPGHQIIDADGSVYPDLAENRENMHLGYLENYISGKYLHVRTGLDPTEIVDQKVWDEVERYLAVGLNNSVVHWSPDVIVLGGGVINSGKVNIDKVRSNLTGYLRIFPSVPEIKMSALGDTAGLYGALAYARKTKGM